jgi:hypothetical protein
MASSTSSGSFSTDVKLRLVIADGLVLRVAQVGRNSLILRDLDCVARNTEAKLIISIDGDDRVQKIILHEGIDDKFVNFRSLDD